MITLKLNSRFVAFLIIVLMTCRMTNTTASKKNGIFILVMNGLIKTDELFIISCQYNVNNKYDEIANGIESSISV